MNKTLALLAFFACLIGAAATIYFNRSASAPEKIQGFDLNSTPAAPISPAIPKPAAMTPPPAPPTALPASTKPQSSLEMFKTANAPKPAQAPARLALNTARQAPAMNATTSAHYQTPTVQTQARGGAAPQAAAAAARGPVDFPHLNAPSHPGMRAGEPVRETREVHMMRIIQRCMRYFLNGAPPVAPTSPDLHVAINYEYYDVHGATNREICTDIARRKTPPNTDSKGWARLLEHGTIFATTHPSWHPKQTIWHKQNECGIKSAEVDTEITITLPRWNKGDDADLNARWDQVLANATNHEQTHAVIDTETGYGYLEDLQGLGTQPCDNFQKAMQDAWNKRQAESDERNEDFDRRTSEGPSSTF